MDYDPNNPINVGDLIPIGIVLVTVLGGGGTLAINAYNNRKNRLKNSLEKGSDIIDKRKHCPNCSSRIGTRDEFCPKCGYKIGEI
ncbi:MAG: hypothetical protein HeimC3_48240 [Candidatus Heimdallarchaeota archaeon LC_3]|nr:MAG: hypothetical protein HeimC3_48240 [Candidatus Heimdallarchaeota archaeon LC_3]